MQTDFDAIVIGAGPAGASAAILLAQAGWSVALVEKQRFPRRKVCGECIAASNLPLIEALGLGAIFDAQAGPPLRRMALMHGARTVIADLPAADDPRHPWGRALGRETLDTLLLARARAAGATVLQPWAVEAVDGSPGDHRCTVRPPATGEPEDAGEGKGTREAGDASLAAAVGVRHPAVAWAADPAGRAADLASGAAEAARARSAGRGVEAREASTAARSFKPGQARAAAEASAPGRTGCVLRTPVLIAAHGSWEPLPAARAGRREARRPRDLFAFKANFIDASLPDGLLPVLAFDGGYGGMVVADGGVTTLACCIRADRLDACRVAAPGLRAGDAVEALLRRACVGVAEALRGSRRDGPWLASGPLDPGVRIDAADPLLRVGNAAGEAHPIIGEGMSMALQSAWLLCGHLLAADARPRDAAWQIDLRRRYAAQWRRQFAPRLGLAAAFAHAAMRPAAAAALTALAGGWPGVLTAGARLAGKGRCAADAATIEALSRMPSGGSSATLPHPHRGAPLERAPPGPP